MSVALTQSVAQETDMIVDDSEIVSLLKGPGKGRVIPEPYRSRIVSSIFTPPDGPKDAFGVFAIMEGAHAPELYAMLLAHAVELHHEMTPQQTRDDGRRAIEEGKPTFCGLPRGLLLAERRMESPYVIHFREQCTLSNWLIDEGWGQGWGFWGWADMAAAQNRAQPGAQVLADSSLSDGGLGLRTREAHTPALQQGVGDPNDPMPQALVHVLSRHFRKFGMVELQESEDVKPRTVYFRFYDPNVMNTWVPTLNEQEIIKLFGNDLLIQGILAERFSPAELLSEPQKIERYRPGKTPGDGTVEIVRHLGNIKNGTVSVPFEYSAEEAKTAFQLYRSLEFETNPATHQAARTPNGPLCLEAIQAFSRYQKSGVRLEKQTAFSFEQTRQVLFALGPLPSMNDQSNTGRLEYETLANLLLAKTKRLGFSSESSLVAMAAFIRNFGWGVFDNPTFINVLENTNTQNVIEPLNRLYLAYQKNEWNL